MMKWVWIQAKTARNLISPLPVNSRRWTCVSEMHQIMIWQNITKLQRNFRESYRACQTLSSVVMQCWRINVKRGICSSCFIVHVAMWTIWQETSTIHQLWSHVFFSSLRLIDVPFDGAVWPSHPDHKFAVSILILMMVDVELRILERKSLCANVCLSHLLYLLAEIRWLTLQISNMVSKTGELRLFTSSIDEAVKLPLCIVWLHKISLAFFQWLLLALERVESKGWYYRQKVCLLMLFEDISKIFLWIKT